MTSVTTRDSLAASSRTVLAAHGKSFSWAAFWLGRTARDEGSIVYAFCRAADDAVDEAASLESARREIRYLRSMLRGDEPPSPLVVAYRAILEKHATGLRPAEQLLDGIESDLAAVRMEDDLDLIRYCYRVAGTVGLMMCGVLGAQHPNAAKHAVDLGIAMQLTNICRDVLEDAERGRVYLPRDRLLAVGVRSEELLDAQARECPRVRAGIRQVVSDLLVLADRFYADAALGYRYLPARGRLAAMVAGRLYRAIGHRLRQRGSDPLSGRVFIGALSKAMLLFGTAARWSLDWVGSRSLRHEIARVPTP